RVLMGNCLHRDAFPDDTSGLEGAYGDTICSHLVPTLVPNPEDGAAADPDRVPVPSPSHVSLRIVPVCGRPAAGTLACSVLASAVDRRSRRNANCAWVCPRAGAAVRLYAT